LSGARMCRNHNAIRDAGAWRLDAAVVGDGKVTGPRLEPVHGIVGIATRFFETRPRIRDTLRRL
jgi:hypothetical protein